MSLLKLGSEPQNWSRFEQANKMHSEFPRNGIFQRSQMHKGVSCVVRDVSNRILFSICTISLKPFEKYLFCTYPKIFYKQSLRKSFLTAILFHSMQPHLYQKCVFFDKSVLEKVLSSAHVRNENWKRVTSHY